MYNIYICTYIYIYSSSHIRETEGERERETENTEEPYIKEGSVLTRQKCGLARFPSPEVQTAAMAAPSSSLARSSSCMSTPAIV